MVALHVFILSSGRCRLALSRGRHNEGEDPSTNEESRAADLRVCLPHQDHVLSKTELNERGYY
jgi:hypothetical protein